MNDCITRSQKFLFWNSKLGKREFVSISETESQQSFLNVEKELQIPAFFWKKSSGSPRMRKSGLLAQSRREAHVAAPTWPILGKLAPRGLSAAFARSADGSLAGTAAVGAVPKRLRVVAPSGPSKLLASAPPWLPKALPSSSPKRTCSFRISAATSRPSPQRSSSGTPSSCPPSPSVSAGSRRAGEAAGRSRRTRTWQGRADP